LLAGLNDQQREAVLATDGPVLILAGAGSGKTRVITHRLAYLVRERGLPARALLAVTFTNKAAGEMKARAEALLGGGEIESWICTFHSFCVRLLRRHAPEAGIDHSFLIWDEDDQMEAVRQALRALNLPEKLYPPRRLLSDISAAKNSGGAPRGEPDSPWQETLGQVKERYQALLAASRALDFDDLLLKAAALLEGDERVRELWRSRFRYVLVDEYQDTNRVQYSLMRALVGTQGNITVVGDEDQSIYSWRGADINNILDFERDFPNARVLRLEENYRSTQAILDAASAVVAHNRQRKGKTLRATRPGGDAVRLHQASDEFHEASWVVGQIGRSPRGQRSAVLYRMNAQSRLFEEALMRQGLAYTVVGGVGFYERREVKDLLAYLRLVLNPDDSMALRRVINVPARGIGERTLELLQSLAAQGGTSLWQAVGRADDENLLPARATLPLRRFRE
ncbi:MAG TPA: UvrD-helicase domain-containing protein, partial [Vicinamibacteria bacterium]|nr:UvrD-helicase domain-containing protein [Vicinamibacteria bacterium]